VKSWLELSPRNEVVIAAKLAHHSKKPCPQLEPG
jgi:hypothetical protein